MRINIKRQSKNQNKDRGKIIGRALDAIVFIQTHRYWTIQDLSDALGISRQNGSRWLVELSVKFPIIEVKPQRHSGRRGYLPAIYSLTKDS